MPKSLLPPKSRASGGPRTEEGKKIASRNSLKTGVYSKLAVLPGESQEEFNLLVEQLHQDFCPNDAVEKTLINDLAVLTWKKSRLVQLEQSGFLRKLAAPITLEEFTASGIKFTKEAFQFWKERECFTEEERAAYKKMLDIVKPLQRRKIGITQLTEIKESCPEIYKSILDTYRSFNSLDDEEPPLEALIKEIVFPRDQDAQYIVEYVIGYIIPAYEAALWCTKNAEKINEAVALIKQERLLKAMQIDVSSRAQDDLSRSYLRIMNEYRTHHDWRNQQRFVNAKLVNKNES
jgi:hypothetical protein